MKRERFYEAMDPARVALLLGLSVGLGIALHEAFLLVAGAIACGGRERDSRPRGSQPLEPPAPLGNEGGL